MSIMLTTGNRLHRAILQWRWRIFKPVIVVSLIVFMGLIYFFDSMEYRLLSHHELNFCSSSTGKSHNGFQNAARQGGSAFLPVAEAELMCAKEGLKPYPTRDRHRKIYDLFIVGNEMDWVEIRLNELASEVDYFVILEADKTFTNKPKRLDFKDNFKRFSKFESKIIYRVLDDDDSITFYWDRERFQRNALLTQVFPSLVGAGAPRDGDVIMVSDADEIPRRETLVKLRNCDIHERTGLFSRLFLYSFQWHRNEGDWYHPQATVWQGQSTIPPESLRMERTSHNFLNASWHCTNCFDSVQAFVDKLESFSHQEYNKAEFRDPLSIVRRVKNGLDVFDRDYVYEKIDRQSMDMPEYLRQNVQRFPYLVDRDALNANFRDA